MYKAIEADVRINELKAKVMKVSKGFYEMKQERDTFAAALKECADLLERNGFGTQVPYYIQHLINQED